MATAGFVPAFALLVIAPLLAACETLDQHAVAETHRLGDAPYYVEIKEPPPTGNCALVLPVAVAPALAEQFGYGDRLREFESLRSALDARLATREGCIRSVAPAPAMSGAPRMYVGTSGSKYAPPEVQSQRMDTDRFAPMVLYLERPTVGWRGDIADTLLQSERPYAVAIQLGVSQYAKGYSGAFRKQVVLGSGYRVPIRFLTSEVKPVEVLHLTGVLVDIEGRPVRVGVEGIVLRDTPFLAQSIEASRVFDPTELQRVLTDERRTDLPGAPLAMEVALDNLIAQLTRGEVRVPALP